MEEDKVLLPTAGLLVIEDGKLLLAYSAHKQAWYLPGGKIDGKETSREAMIREIGEELNIKIKDEQLSYYCHITAQAYSEEENVIMEQDCFLYHLREEITPSHEIKAVRFFSYAEYMQEEVQVIGVLKVFEQLKQDGYLL